MTAIGRKVESRSATVAVVGVGYVGLPLACHFSTAGFDVVGFDVDEDRMAALRNGSSYVDDVPDRDVTEALEAGFEPTTDPTRLSAADAFVVAVPTGMNGDEPDMSAVRIASRTIAKYAPDREILYVCSSTVYPGAADEIVRDELRVFGRTPGDDALVAVVPERIDPGGEYPFEEIPLIVGADTDRERTAARALFDAVTVKTVPVNSTKAAEMTKTLENTYRMVNIGLVNEVARYAEEIGVDVWEVIDAADTKPFGFQAFYPGPGVGGHCIPIDPRFLTWLGRRHDQPLEMVEQANGMNGRMPVHVVDRLRTALEARGVPLEDANVAVLGLTYKPDVADVRNAPALTIYESLVSRGASVVPVDPHVDSVAVDGERVEPEPEIDRDVISGSDVVLLLVDHDDFEYGPLEDAPLVFDAQDALPSDLSMPVLRLGDGTTTEVDQRRLASSATSSTTFQS
ncbi:nucleotide sugar dehydrogenase [Natrarchaeobius oligotrophus]|uniref:UDP-N-acetyl-D-mannosamine dehydrogenase n=1 Tax=Natrarchaeobius chitinivorans TaxID=1679083 RepID=A0A3N6M0Y4_NATCH|nr:nucleotide sugar dehydrogenase [Natrarchaeobius chitinivorans]RQG96953.1 nucleotide sugar dehydrogenase [Natrarchaeobius chitinivorans]